MHFGDRLYFTELVWDASNCIVHVCMSLLQFGAFKQFRGGGIPMSELEGEAKRTSGELGPVL